MEYIQQVFLGVQRFMQRGRDPGLEALIAFLDSEPAEFRSVAYESASLEVALRDLSKGGGLREWERFYARSGTAHSFHLGIGLGWAFAKLDKIPDPDWKPRGPSMLRMVFDGMGYYHGLFRGRRSVKYQMVPQGVEGRDLEGYDQGLGRRLWYVARGEVEKVARLTEAFPAARRPALWRGTGIACGYVGGCEQEDLLLLAKVSAEHRPQLCSGIALATISRMASESVTDDITTACRILCETTPEEAAAQGEKITNEAGLDTE